MLAKVCHAEVCQCAEGKEHINIPVDKNHSWENSYTQKRPMHLFYAFTLMHKLEHKISTHVLLKTFVLKISRIILIVACDIYQHMPMIKKKNYHTSNEVVSCFVFCYNVERMSNFRLYLSKYPHRDR